MEPETAVASITLKNVPEALHERLKEEAARRRRSLNSEILVRLERSLGVAPVDAEGLLARARAVRERLDVPYLTDAELRDARAEGRP